MLMLPMQNLDVFKKNYLVVGLNDEQVSEIASLATFRRLTAQERLIRAGDQGCDLFVILDGRLNVLTPDGDKLSEVGPGSVLGEIGLIDARPRAADVIAIGLVDVAVIPAGELRRRMNQNREMGFVILANLARVLCGRLRQANEKLDELYDKTTDSWDRAL
jgi:CRP-like cAMP-binding protein